MRWRKNKYQRKPQSNDVVSLEVLELGLLFNISEDFRSKFSIPENFSGVLVLNVRSDTDASDKGIFPGDIIVEVSQNKVFTPCDVSMRVAEEINLLEILLYFLLIVRVLCPILL